MNTEVASTAPKPFVFVLMPFDTSFNDVYALGIRPACEAAGAYCERVDEQIFQESILQRIYNQISKADVIVADMTRRNANVFYETGYAHALGKHVILLTQDGNDIPFDLKHYPHIIYGGSIASMKQDLERRVRWCIERPNHSAQSLTQSLEIYVNGTKIEGGERINIKTTKVTSGVPFALNVMLHNAGDRTYKGVGGTDFGLFLPQEFFVYDVRGDYADTDEDYSLPLPDGRALHSFGPLENILPDKWEGVKLMITSGSDNPLVVEKEYPVTARLYTEEGPRDAELFIILYNEESADEAQYGENQNKHNGPVSQVARQLYSNVDKDKSQRISRLTGTVENNLDIMRKAFDLIKTLSVEDQSFLDDGLSVVTSYSDMPYALRAYLACDGDRERLKSIVGDLREQKEREPINPISALYRDYTSPLIAFHPEADRIFTEIDTQLRVICKTLDLKFPGGGTGRFGGKRELTSSQWTPTDLTRAYNILSAAKSVLE